MFVSWRNSLWQILNGLVVLSLNLSLYPEFSNYFAVVSRHSLKVAAAIDFAFRQVFGENFRSICKGCHIYTLKV